MVYGIPHHPVEPYDPVVVPRRRPGTVTAAGALLYGGGAVGLVASLALLGAAGSVVDDFRFQALLLGVPPEDATAVARAVRTALLSSGAGALALAAVSIPLGRGVLRRSEAARVGALLVAGASLACALVRTSVTAFGGAVDWSVAADRSDPVLRDQVADAFGTAMPGWLVGLFGGLTDLQSLGYIAVAALLVAPASREYFRTRIVWTFQAPE